MLYLYHRQSMSTCGISAHCPCRLIARQDEVEIRDHLGKFDYGPAHASRNHHYTYVCQQKLANPMEAWKVLISD